MLVLSNLDAVSHTSLEDELSVLGSYVTALQVFVRWVVRSFEDDQEGLNHMVAVHVHSQVDNLPVQSSYYLHQVGVIDEDLAVDFFAVGSGLLVLKNVVGESVD